MPRLTKPNPHLLGPVTQQDAYKPPRVPHPAMTRCPDRRRACSSMAPTGRRHPSRTLHTGLGRRHLARYVRREHYAYLMLAQRRVATGRRHVSLAVWAKATDIGAKKTENAPATPPISCTASHQSGLLGPRHPRPLESSLPVSPSATCRFPRTNIKTGHRGLTLATGHEQSMNREGGKSLVLFDEKPNPSRKGVEAPAPYLPVPTPMQCSNDEKKGTLLLRSERRIWPSWFEAVESSFGVKSNRGIMDRSLFVQTKWGRGRAVAGKCGDAAQKRV